MTEELTGRPVDWQRMRAVGKFPARYAEALVADWHQDEITSLDKFHDLVRDTGATVNVAVRFAGFSENEVGAHLLVMYRGADGNVWITEKVGGTIHTYRYPPPLGDNVIGIYAIVINGDGSAEVSSARTENHAVSPV